jgi:hypothetical protein
VNAIDIIERVRAHDAELVLDDRRLILRGHGARLPDELSEAVRQHRWEILAALGAPHDVVVADLLGAIRPYLAPSLQSLPDNKLLALVNWHMMHALARAVAEFRTEDQR